jgi:hypothetical protein
MRQVLFSETSDEGNCGKSTQTIWKTITLWHCLISLIYFLGLSEKELLLFQNLIYVVVAFVLLVAIILIFVFLRRRRRTRIITSGSDIDVIRLLPADEDNNRSSIEKLSMAQEDAGDGEKLFNVTEC